MGMKKAFLGFSLIFLVSATLLFSAFHVQPVRAEGTIYIRADGSIDPPAAPIQQNGDIYTFTDDIISTADGIVVERSNIVIDGAGQTLIGPGKENGTTGFILSPLNPKVSNITIRKANIVGFGIGISGDHVVGNFFCENNVTDNQLGIGVRGDGSATISDNNIANNYYGVDGSYLTLMNNSISYNALGVDVSLSAYVVNNRVEHNNQGMHLQRVSNGRLRNNNMSNNLQNFGVTGTSLTEFSLDIDTSNIVDGKPIYYWVAHQNEKVPLDAGYVALVDSNNITVEGLNLRNNEEAVLLAFTQNSVIIGNDLKGNGHCIFVDRQCSNINVSGNRITDSVVGIGIYYSSNNQVVYNSLINNEYGFSFALSGNNTIHHNIMDNIVQIYPQYYVVDTWDNGYPSGGNYWNDYIDIDLCGGVYQNETGSDGIWDHPYQININNKDRYPLVNPRSSILGVDVSHHQGNINWSDVRNAGYRFAFVKATEGEGWTGDPEAKDDYFEINMDGASKAGMIAGAYHFALPDLNDPVDEATWFIHVARNYLKGGYLRPVLDLERGSSLGKEALSNWVRTWMETVETETGVEPIIYTGGDYVNPAVNILDVSLTEYDLWIAHWTYNLSISPNTGLWDKWEFWQWTNTSLVPGIDGYVDSDIFAYEFDTEIQKIELSKNIVGKGYTLIANVTVANLGLYSEELSVTVFANMTLIASRTITLPSANSTTITLTIDTSGLAVDSYITRFYVTPVWGETDTEDNSLNDGILHVAVPGDINADTAVDIFDAILLAGCFSSYPASPHWNPNADINSDNIVDIYDAIILAGHFNEHV
jgi:parallel beta-helix repeat protein